MSAYSEKPAANRLLQLSEEVSRIATSLAQLSAEPTAPPPEKVGGGGQGADVTAEEIEDVIYRRGRRGAYFPHDLLSDPAWDMMLELLRAEVRQRRLSVSKVCAAAGVPTSTAQRWLRSLEQRGLVVRRADPLDCRREFVELTEDASLALRRWFADRSGEAA